MSLDDWWEEFKKWRDGHYNECTFVPKGDPPHLFDFSTMAHEWIDFLKTQCGFDQVDPELLVRLIAKNIELFKAAIKENGLTWNEVEGSFTVDVRTWAAWAGKDHAVGLGSSPAMREVWIQCFDQTAVDHYDKIETDLWHEKKHGLS